MTELAALIEKLTEATEGSALLDGRIAYEVLHCSYYVGENGSCELLKKDSTESLGPCPAYTTSLDAALTLVPEGHSWLIENDCHHHHVPRAWVKRGPDVRHDSPALALCIAALKARAS